MLNRIINSGEFFWENAQQAWKGALPGMGLEGITLGSKVSANGPLRVFRESKSLSAGLEEGANSKNAFGVSGQNSSSIPATLCLSFMWICFITFTLTEDPISTAQVGKQNLAGD
jgi:hypothetical protein